MESLKEMYKVGSGPSSSHTIAPQRALTLFKQAHPEVNHYVVDLYGSLSLTGKGHFTDRACQMAVEPISCEVNFKLDWEYDFDNGFIINGYQDNHLIDSWVVYSLGGGSIQILDHDYDFQKQIYPHQHMDDIREYCRVRDFHYHDYVYEVEPDIKDYLSMILDKMIESVNRGLQKDGMLPGLLKVSKIAKEMHNQIDDDLPVDQLYRQKMTSYSYAVMEENASLGEVVTAPTCGASGILAATIYHYLYDLAFSRDQLIDALAVAGLFGNIVKTNATISGAQGGCQAEVGVGCAMSSAAVAFLEKGNLDQVEYAAEIGMEHHLGLTCDPVGGYVIIPCIERNAVATMRAKDAAFMANTIGKIRPNRVSFDTVVKTMKYTGSRIAIELRETSLGGLAQEIKVDALKN